MKTINILKQYFPVAVLSLVLIASSLEAGAQNHRNEGKRDNERDHDQNEYRQDDRNQERTANNEWRERKEGNRDNRNYESRDNRDEYRPQYSQRNGYSRQNYYNHSQYGRVYNRFDRNPMVFEHSRGNYYYSGNNFYRYNDRIGYCRIEPPRNVYFRDLPFDCDRVYIGGQVFFRNGDLFFQLSRRGYVIVPSPIEFRFSARF
ncbi:MAG: hypothetical protein Q8N05_12680 [Bacteroidota bacterium]|nr:hypothetical protein [Bacteroidota bacterium]